MKSEAVQIAKINKEIAMMNMVQNVIINPGYILIAGFILDEYLQTVKIGTDDKGRSRYLMPGVAGTFLEAGLLGYALSPLIQKGMESSTKVAEAGLSAAGKLLTKAGIAAAIGG